MPKNIGTKNVNDNTICVGFKAVIWHEFWGSTGSIYIMGLELK